MPNPNEVQDVSEGGMTSFQQDYVIDLKKLREDNKDPIAELDKKKFLCRYPFIINIYLKPTLRILS